MNVHRLLRVKPIESITKNKSEWIDFILFNIWTTFAPQVLFLQMFLEIYSKTFVSSQRYGNMIASSIFRILKFLPMFQMLFL
jgi:hypothetical protein